MKLTFIAADFDDLSQPIYNTPEEGDIFNTSTKQFSSCEDCPVARVLQRQEGLEPNVWSFLPKIAFEPWHLNEIRKQLLAGAESVIWETREDEPAPDQEEVYPEDKYL